LRHTPEAAIERIYRRFYPAGRPIAGPRTPSETSTEFLNKLNQRVIQIGEDSRFESLLNSLTGNAIKLTELYHSTLFLPLQTTRRDAQHAWRIWKQLRLQLFAARLMMLFVHHHSG
jgi:hypothetical protein